VITNVRVLLKRCLRREWASPKLHLTPGDIAELYVCRQSECRSPAKGPRRIEQRVVVAQKSESQAVNIFSPRQIHADRVRRRIVAVLVKLIVVSEIIDRLVPVVGKPVERPCLRRCLPIQLPDGRSIAERRRKRTAESLKRRWHHHRSVRVLDHMLRVQKEENLVLDQSSAQPAAKILPPKWKIFSPGLPRKSDALVAE